MSERLRTLFEQAGDDWYVTIKLDEYPIFEECYFGEFEAREKADEFLEALRRDLCVEAIERSARVCEEVSKSEHRTVSERALARVLAERIRGGGA